MLNKNTGPQKTCFVVMGFGKKTDFETGRVLDLDKSYKNMIKPAVEAAGLKCIRADEIVHSGLIDKPMYERLLNADVVVADLSTSNKNVFYELGIRHALRPFTTVVISEDGIKTFPFDVNHVAVQQYHHMGDDIGYEVVKNFKKKLTKAIKAIMNKDPREKDSPVYTFLDGLTPPELATVKKNVQQVMNANTKSMNILSEPTTIYGSDSGHNETHSILMEQVDDAQKKKDWLKAKNLLSEIRQMKLNEIIKRQEGASIKLAKPQEDPWIIQRLALITYKSKSDQPEEKEALLEAYHLLEILHPRTSNDTETLGLWGAVHKRLYELTKNYKCLDEAIQAYQRGFFLKNDYYNGINFAFLLNVRSSLEVNRAEAITDFMEARRVRKKVLEICKDWLSNNPNDHEKALPKNALTNHLKSIYWVKATMGEAYLGTGENGKAEKELQEAYAKEPEDWMRRSTETQLSKLKHLLSNSPLKFIQEENVA